MSQILFHYEQLQPTTWAYLSALLSVALFFKFNRILSLRNLDLVLLAMLGPGLLCVRFSYESGPEAATVAKFGYVWLFAINGCLLLRALLDSAMTRRPLLEPNMNIAGLMFLGMSLFCFLMANVLTSDTTIDDLSAVQRAEHLSRREFSRVEQSTLNTHGPGFAALLALPHLSTQRLLGHNAAQPSDEPVTGSETTTPVDIADEAAESLDQPTTAQFVTARVAAILSQMAIVVGMVLIGARHFDSLAMGVASASLYLMVPYTAMWTAAVTHVLPAALLVWAVFNYRRPLFAGLFLGLACGTIYYPVFLLPLWMSFYFRRGMWRLLIGVTIALAILMVTQIFTSTDVAMFSARVQQMFGLRWPQTEGLGGVWQYWYSVYRLPILAAFVGLSVVCLPIWPVQKNLGSLISCSAVVMLGVQFWHAHTGGLALAWYLPLLLLMIFRTNLEDRVAINTVRPA